jgi:bleomycin hydrolase
MFVNLIEKYGIVPKTNMDDDFHSANSDELTSFYNDFLRKSAKRVRESKENVIVEILQECYKILVVFLGEPPTKITWEYYSKGKGSNKDANKKYNVVKDIDPVTFYKKYVPYDAKTKVCLMNYPCKQAPYYKAYEIELNQKMETTHNSKYVNVPIEVMRNAIKKSIDRQEAVWIGCDVDKYFSRKNNKLDSKSSENGS